MLRIGGVAALCGGCRPPPLPRPRLTPLPPLPGGNLTVHYVQKKAKGARCAGCSKGLQGIPRLRPYEYKNIPKSARTVSRPYGGSQCATCTRDRVLRAFIIEERKIVKRVLAAKAASKA